MPVSLPYLSSNKNIGALFDKIASAKIPSKFTHDFLQTTIGLKGNNDRPLIPLLRNLGFVDQSGTPLPTYALLKGDRRALAVADGIRAAYAPLFNSDENANALSGDKLRSLVAQVAGTDDDMTARIASTFSALVKHGDFTGSKKPADETKKETDKGKGNEGDKHSEDAQRLKGMRTEFHYNIQIHLPTNAAEETYQNIFNAIRKTFQ